MKRKTFIILSLITIFNYSLISAPSKNGTYTDPANVDADYAIQGEYCVFYSSFFCKIEFHSQSKF